MSSAELLSWWSSLDTAARDRVVEAWREESCSLLTQERIATTTGGGALATVLTLLIAIAAFGFGGTTPGHELILLALPPALALIGTYLQQRHGDGIVMRAARRDLEEALETVLGVPTHIYARYVAPVRMVTRRSPSSVLTLIINGTLLFGLTACIWSYVPGSNPAVRHADAIETIAVTVTLLTFAPFLVAGIENHWLLPKALEGKVAQAILARIADTSQPSQVEGPGVSDRDQVVRPIC